MAHPGVRAGHRRRAVHDPALPRWVRLRAALARLHERCGDVLYNLERFADAEREYAQAIDTGAAARRAVASRADALLRLP